MITAATKRNARNEVLMARLSENQFITHSYLLLLAGVGSGLAASGIRESGFNLLSQVHRSARANWLKNIVEPWITKNLDIHSLPRSTGRTQAYASAFLGGRILALKPKVSAQERGVILVKYSEMMPLLSEFFDVEKMLRDYALVIEPSWSGYCTADLLHFTSYSRDVFILAKQPDDYRFLCSLDSNVRPLKLGPCDWVDPSIADQYLGEEKIFDVVVNSNWGMPKRHHVLFSCLRSLDPAIRVALIGFDWHGRSAQDVLNIAHHYGVREQITVFDRIDFEEVMKVNCQSKLAILLSLKEGSNRAIAESFFCNIPAIVLENHVGGITENVTPSTGRSVRERDLPRAIGWMLQHLDEFQPREWALRNISCYESTRRLNNAVKERALEQGEEWTKDIVVRSNSPDLRIVNREVAPCLLEHSRSLIDYLR